MTTEQAVKELNAIPDGDQETAHVEADQILLAWASANNGQAVVEALLAVRKRVGGFWYA